MTAPDIALDVRAVTSLEELLGLRDAWEGVFARAETRSPFLCHEWIVSWWESFGGDQELRVLVVEDGDGVAAIAPLARAHRSFGLVSIRALEIIGTGPLRFLGMGLADRADFLIARRPGDCLAAIVGHLAAVRSGWDVLDLRFVPETSSTVRELPALAEAHGLGLSHERCAESPYLALVGTWGDYLARRSSNFRKGLRRKQRRLEEAGEVTIDLAAEERDPEEALRAAIEVSLASWKESAGSALLMHEKVRGFFGRLVPRLSASGRLYIALCRVSGEPVAHELGFRMDRKLWSYDSCFKASHATGSPGILVTARLLEWAWAAGLVEYDFLRGDHGYKRSWRTESRHEQQIVLDAGHMHGRLARRLGYDLKWAAKRSPRLVALQSQLAGILNRALARRDDR